MQKEDFQKLVNSCSKISQVAAQLGVSQTQARKLMILNGIDYSHFRMKKVYEKMVGEKFGKLKVISIEYFGRRAKAHCICDCKNEKIARCDAIKDGTLISCGCHTHDRWNTVGNKNHAFAGVGKLGTVKFQEIKKGADRRKISFNITIQEMWDVYEKQEGKCAITGMPIWFGRVRVSHETNASLDRIDSVKGYTKDNVEWVLKDINRAKGTLDKEYFIKLCNLVAKNNPRIIT